MAGRARAFAPFWEPALGVCISGGLALLFGSIGHLNGFHMSEVESMVYIANASKLRVGDLLYAGVLISGLGAVMDVSVSMAAAMEEVHAKAPELSPWELFRSGMTVGHDMIGTMSNTLILAYTGLRHRCPAHHLFLRNALPAGDRIQLHHDRTALWPVRHHRRDPHRTHPGRDHRLRAAKKQLETTIPIHYQD